MDWIRLGNGRIKANQTDEQLHRLIQYFMEPLQQSPSQVSDALEQNPLQWFIDFSTHNHVFANASESVRQTIRVTLQNKIEMSLNFPIDHTMETAAVFCARKIDKYYQCYDCRMSDETIVCENCFEPQKHKGHYYKFVNQAGFCDCGDQKKWSPEGTCSNHGKDKIIKDLNIDQGDRQTFHSFFIGCFRIAFALAEQATSNSHQEFQKCAKQYYSLLINLLIAKNSQSQYYNKLTAEVLLTQVEQSKGQNQETDTEGYQKWTIIWGCLINQLAIEDLINSMYYIDELLEEYYRVMGQHLTNRKIQAANTDKQIRSNLQVLETLGRQGFLVNCKQDIEVIAFYHNKLTEVAFPNRYWQQKPHVLRSCWLLIVQRNMLVSSPKSLCFFSAILADCKHDSKLFWTIISILLKGVDPAQTDSLPPSETRRDYPVMLNILVKGLMMLCHGNEHSAVQQLVNKDHLALNQVNRFETLVTESIRWLIVHPGKTSYLTIRFVSLYISMRPEGQFSLKFCKSIQSVASPCNLLFLIEMIKICLAEEIKSVWIYSKYATAKDRTNRHARNEICLEAQRQIFKEHLFAREQISREQLIQEKKIGVLNFEGAQAVLRDYAIFIKEQGVFQFRHKMGNQECFQHITGIVKQITVFLKLLESSNFGDKYPFIKEHRKLAKDRLKLVCPSILFSPGPDQQLARWFEYSKYAQASVSIFENILSPILNCSELYEPAGEVIRERTLEGNKLSEELLYNIEYIKGLTLVVIDKVLGGRHARLRSHLLQVGTEVESDIQSMISMWHDANHLRPNQPSCEDLEVSYQLMKDPIDSRWLYLHPQQRQKHTESMRIAENNMTRMLADLSLPSADHDNSQSSQAQRDEKSGEKQQESSLDPDYSSRKKLMQKKKEAMSRKYKESRQQYFENACLPVARQSSQPEFTCMVCQEHRDHLDNRRKQMFFAANITRKNILNNFFPQESSVGNTRLSTCFHTMDWKCFENLVGKSSRKNCPLCREPLNTLLPVSYESLMNESGEEMLYWANRTSFVMVQEFNDYGFRSIEDLIIRHWVCKYGFPRLLSLEEESKKSESQKEGERRLNNYLWEVFLTIYDRWGQPQRKALKTRIDAMATKSRSNQFRPAGLFEEALLYAIWDTLQLTDTGTLRYSQLTKVLFQLKEILNPVIYHAFSRSLWRFLDSYVDEDQIEHIFMMDCRTPVSEQLLKTAIFSLLFPKLFPDLEALFALRTICERCHHCDNFYCYQCSQTYCQRCDNLNAHRKERHSLATFFMLNSGKVKVKSLSISNDIDVYFNAFREENSQENREQHRSDYLLDMETLQAQVFSILKNIV